MRPNMLLYQIIKFGFEYT